MKRFILSSIMFLLIIHHVAFAAVSGTTVKDIYTANGTQTVWPYTFSIVASTDIKLYYIDSSGTETAITSNYSVNTTNKQVTYPVSGSPLTSGYQLILIRETPYTQTLTLTTQGPFPALSLNNEFDKLTMLVQQIKEKTDRSVLLSKIESSGLVLPAAEEGYSLVWDASGNLVNSNLKGEKGDTGATGPAGAGSGDVLGPATNTDEYIPQWDGADTKTLKNGLAVGTSANNIVQLDGDAKLPAVDGSNLTNVSVSITGSVSGSTFTDLDSIPAEAGYIPSDNIDSLPDSSLAQITTAGKVSGASLTSLASIPAGAGLIPAVNTATQYYVGTFTRDLTTANGTVNITGVGFQPTLVYFMGGVNANNGNRCQGIDTATKHYAVGVKDDDYTTVIDSSCSLTFRKDGSNYYRGYISIMGADGFTVSWTKTGSPTGTATIYFIAIR